MEGGMGSISESLRRVCENHSVKIQTNCNVQQVLIEDGKARGVVLEDGSLPSSTGYLKRSFSRMIPFEAFSFLGSEARGWHDTISKTYVVDIARFEAKKKSQNELDQIGVAQEI